MTYTPGPWVVVKDSNGDYDVKSSDKSPWEIAMAINHAGPDGKSTLANARLIATAPELLEALESCMWMIDAQEGRSDEDDKLVDAARAAIKKAKGE